MIKLVSTDTLLPNITLRQYVAKVWLVTIIINGSFSNWFLHFLLVVMSLRTDYPGIIIDWWILLL